jgi:hypothetical protein
MAKTNDKQNGPTSTGPLTTLNHYTEIGSMSIKLVGCTPELAARNKQKAFQCRVWGEADMVKTRLNKAGEPFSYVLGDFRAVNQDNAGFKSQKLFLPEGIIDALQIATKRSNGQSVRFGYDIFAIPDSGSSVGYVYEAVALLDPAPADRLKDMNKQLAVGRTTA